MFMKKLRIILITAPPPLKPSIDKPIRIQFKKKRKEKTEI